MTLDARALRRDFPILAGEGPGRLVYLDSAATSQKPRAVLDAVDAYYRESNANVHRSVHRLAERATELFEGARERVAAFVGARDAHEIVFVRNATEASNLLARSLGPARLAPGDEVVVAVWNHHSALVPWQRAAAASGARIVAVPLDDGLDLTPAAVERAIGPRTRFVVLTQKSNVLGAAVPPAGLAEIARAAHRAGALVFLDAAQSVPHGRVDVGALGADFLAFSGHKMLGPMGIGALWGRRELLEATEPFLAGGEMVREVEIDRATWNDVPWKFEAGTPDVAGAVGLAAAIRYLEDVGLEAIEAHERRLAEAAFERLRTVPGVRTFRPRSGSTGIVAFAVEGVHPHDAAAILDEEGVAVRGGHHCAAPLHAALGVPATLRASFYLYSEEEDVERLGRAVERVREVFPAPR